MKEFFLPPDAPSLRVVHYGTPLRAWIDASRRGSRYWTVRRQKR